MMSLDGYFESMDHALDWHHVDEEFNRFAAHQLSEVGTLLFGRVTYELMASYWTSEAALTNDRTIAGYMNSLPKIVFSNSLKAASWKNSKVMNTVDVKEIQRLRQQAEKDLILLGSARLTSSFIRFGLINEYRIMVNPVILGNGVPLFKETPQQLRLLQARTFTSGNILLYYEPKELP